MTMDYRFSVRWETITGNTLLGGGMPPINRLVVMVILGRLVLAVVYWVTIYWWLWIFVGGKADVVLDKTFYYLWDKIDTY